jgi:hypothetical protein
MNAGVEKNMILKYQEVFDFLKQNRQLVMYVMLVHCLSKLHLPKSSGAMPRRTELIASLLYF